MFLLFLEGRSRRRWLDSNLTLISILANDSSAKITYSKSSFSSFKKLLKKKSNPFHLFQKHLSVYPRFIRSAQSIANRRLRE